MGAWKEVWECGGGGVGEIKLLCSHTPIPPYSHTFILPYLRLDHVNNNVGRELHKPLIE